MALQGLADSQNKALRAAPRVARALLAPNESVVGGHRDRLGRGRGDVCVRRIEK